MVTRPPSATRDGVYKGTSQVPIREERQKDTHTLHYPVCCSEYGDSGLRNFKGWGYDGMEVKGLNPRRRHATALLLFTSWKVGFTGVPRSQETPTP